MPGQYGLPFYVANSDFEAVLFTDTNGNILRFCEDQLYEALDHRLIWIDSSGMRWGEENNGEWESADWQCEVYMLKGLEQSDSLQQTFCQEAQAVPASEVVLFSEDFANSTEDSPHEYWERLLRRGEDLDVSSGYVSVGPLPESQVEADACGESVNAASRPLRSYAGQALRMDPGMGNVALCHETLGLLNRVSGCLQRKSIQGREVLQLASVYTKGERRLKDVSSQNAARPGTSRRSIA